MFRLILLIASLLLTSCDALMYGYPPPQLSVTFITDPPGAVLYNYQGVREGFTPITLYSNINSEMRKKGADLGQMEVRWQSGAVNKVNNIHLDVAQTHTWNYTFQRPNVSGREIDEQFGLQTEALRQQQEQQQLNIFLLQQQQLNQIGVGIGGIIGGGSGQAKQPPPVSNSIQCTSRPLGSTVYTNCY